MRRKNDLRLLFIHRLQFGLVVEYLSLTTSISMYICMTGANFLGPPVCSDLIPSCLTTLEQMFKKQHSSFKISVKGPYS